MENEKMEVRVDEKVLEKEQASKRREARYAIYNKVCRHCNQVLQTTSKKAVVHDLCRREFYLSYQRKVQTRCQPKVSVSSMSKVRKTYFMMQPCEACGFKFLTRQREFLHPISQQMEKHHLCPNCIAMHRAGLLQGITWQPLNEAVIPGVTV